MREILQNFRQMLIPRVRRQGPCQIGDLAVGVTRDVALVVGVTGEAAL